MKDLYEKKGIGVGKSILIPHATDSNFVEDPIEKKDHFTVFYAGSFVAVQNISLIYSIASLVSDHNDIQFVLAGVSDVEYETELAKINYLGLKNITLYKRMDQDELYSYYKRADVLISVRVDGDDLPFKIIEYLSWGKCIVATDRPIHNLVLNKNIACLVEPVAEMLAASLTELKDNPQLRKSFEMEARNYFSAFHSTGQMKSRYAQLINNLTNK